MKHLKDFLRFNLIAAIPTAIICFVFPRLIFFAIPVYFCLVFAFPLLQFLVEYYND